MIIGKAGSDVRERTPEVERIAVGKGLVCYRVSYIVLQAEDPEEALKKSACEACGSVGIASSAGYKI